MSRTIWATAGADEYVVVTVTETTGQDLTGTSWEIGLSPTYGIPPTTWHTPDVTTMTDATGTVKLLSGVTVAGRYWPWVRCSDNPETVVVQCADSVTIA